MVTKSPWLSVVIPTVGRDSLRHTLESIYSQPEYKGVEVLVVADTFGGRSPDLQRAQDFVEDGGYTWLEHDAGVHCVGQPQRTFGARSARAPYVWFSQDDNVAAQGSLAAIKQTIAAQDQPRPLFFRFLSPWREPIWRTPYLILGNIDADCLVFPRKIARRVEWGMRYEGDFDAACRAEQLAGGDVAWCEPIISIARPTPKHLWWTA